MASEYARRGKTIADLICEEDHYIVVELKDRRRVRWARRGNVEVIEFGSLNPKNANYVPGGKVLRTV